MLSGSVTIFQKHFKIVRFLMGFRVRIRKNLYNPSTSNQLQSKKSITSVICDSVLIPKLINSFARVVQLVVHESFECNVPSSRPAGGIFLKLNILLLMISFCTDSQRKKETGRVYFTPASQYKQCKYYFLQNQKFTAPTPIAEIPYIA